jgi:hypothetical protein
MEAAARIVRRRCKKAAVQARRSYHMRTIMAFGFAALLSLLAIGAWSSATTHSANRAEASAASSWPINPLELMRNSKDLAHQQYDAH